MSRIEYHVHDQFFKRATEEDIQTGSNPEAIVTAGILKGAALLDASAVATIEHARLAEEAQRLAETANAKVDELQDQDKKINTKLEGKVDREELKRLAYKDMVGLEDIKAPGTKDEYNFLTGAGWYPFASVFKKTAKRDEVLLKAEYDPQGIGRDVYDMDNMAEGEDSLILTKDERAKIALIDGKANIADVVLKTDKITLDDVEVSGNVDASKVMTGAGWVSISALDEVSKIKTELEANKQAMDACCEKVTRESQQNVESIAEVKATSEQAKALVEEKGRENEAVLTGIRESITENKTAIDELKAKIDQDREAAPVTAPEVTKCCEEVETLKGQVSTLEEKATKAAEKAEGVDTKIKALEAASPDIAKAQEAFKGIEEKINTAATAAQKAEENANFAKNRTDQFQSKFDTIEPQIAEALGKAGAAETTANNTRDTLTPLVNQLKSDVDAAKACCDTNTESIARVEGTAKAAEKTATDVQNTVNTINDSVTTAKNEAETALREVREAVSKVNEQTATVEELKTKSEEQGKTLDAHTISIRDLSGKVDELEKRPAGGEAGPTGPTGPAGPAGPAGAGVPAALVSKIGQIESKISSIEGVSDQNKEDIEELKEKVKEARGVADENSINTTYLTTRVDALERRQVQAGTPAGHEILDTSLLETQIARNTRNVGTVQSIVIKLNPIIQKHTKDIEELTAKMEAMELAGPPGPPGYPPYGPPGPGGGYPPAPGGMPPPIPGGYPGAAAPEMIAPMGPEDVSTLSRDLFATATSFNPNDYTFPRLPSLSMASGRPYSPIEYLHQYWLPIRSMGLKVQEHEGRIAALEGGKTSEGAPAVSVDTSEIQKKLSDLETKVDENDDEIQRNQSDIAGLTTKYSNLEDCCDENKGKIATLEGKVKTLETKTPAAQAAGGEDPKWKAAFELKGKGSDTKDKSSTFAQAIKKLDNSLPAEVALDTQDVHFLAGYDYTVRMENPASTYALSHKKSVTSANWIKEPETALAQLVHTAKLARDNTVFIQSLEDISRCADLSRLCAHSPFLTAKSDNKRALVVKAGTVIKFPAAVGTYQRFAFINTDRSVTHGIGGSQHLFQGGKDYYVWAIADWERQPAPEITFAIHNSTTLPRGETANTAVLIGGFHTLCVDAGDISSNHPLNNYKAGDILPKSVWCLNHMPYCDPAGMVYERMSDIWVDIYLASRKDNKHVSLFGAEVYSGYNPTFQSSSLLSAGKAFPTDRQFVQFSYGTPSGKKADTSTARTVQTVRANTTGGHRNTAGKRLISNIGCEECCGFYWQYLDEYTWGLDQNRGGNTQAYLIISAGGSLYSKEDSTGIGSYARSNYVGQITTNTNKIASYTARGVARPLRPGEQNYFELS